MFLTDFLFNSFRPESDHKFGNKAKQKDRPKSRNTTTSTCFSVSCCSTCFFITTILMGMLAVAIPLYLQQPKVSESIVRYIADKNLPPSIFENLQVNPEHPEGETIWYDILTKGNLGIGEGYMQGKIKLNTLPFLMDLLNNTAVGTGRTQVETNSLSLMVDILAVPLGTMAAVVNQQSMDRSKRVAEQHYDVGNDLYEAMLGTKTMSYTCAYWKNATSLDDAQTEKMDLVFRKLQIPDTLPPSQHVYKIADMGMGWGKVAEYVRDNSPVPTHITGVTLAKQQVAWAKENIKKTVEENKKGVKGTVEFQWSDYRDLCSNPDNKHTFDRIYSIGMLEHVGPKNYATFFSCIKTLLKPESGLAVVHTIGEPDFVSVADPFLEKYIFPGAVIPALSQLTKHFEKDFVLEDFQNFGYDYARTLSEWDKNSKVFFKENPGRYTIEFQRMWEYYLKMCETLFELRVNQLWQFVFSPRPTYRKGIERQT